MKQPIKLPPRPLNPDTIPGRGIHRTRNNSGGPAIQFSPPLFQGEHRIPAPTVSVR